MSNIDNKNMFNYHVIVFNIFIIANNHLYDIDYWQRTCMTRKPSDWKDHFTIDWLIPAVSAKWVEILQYLCLVELQQCVHWFGMNPGREVITSPHIMKLKHIIINKIRSLVFNTYTGLSLRPGVSQVNITSRVKSRVRTVAKIVLRVNLPLDMVRLRLD